MSEFHDWGDIRAELHDGGDEALAAERARTEAWVGAFHLAEERKRLGLTQRQVAELMGVSPAAEGMPTGGGDLRKHSGSGLPAMVAGWFAWWYLRPTDSP
jgi:hypothetical protein